MNLLELIKSIESFDDEGIIFAELIEGNYSSSSEAVVIEMSDDELSLPTTHVANKRCPGKSYFLEVFLVKEMVTDLKLNFISKQFSYELACERIISYAVNDA